MIRAFVISASTLLFSACASIANDTILPISFSKSDSAVRSIFNVPYSDGNECKIASPEQANYELSSRVDIWDRIREGFTLSTAINKRTQIELNWYIKHPSNIARVSARAEPYLYHVVEQLAARKMPMEIALLPIVESAFDPFAYSHGRASGMWQIIPGTGKMLGLKQNWWYDGRRDVVAATGAALTYLEQLSKQFDGDWLLALAAYNSGAGNVQKAIRKNKKKGLPTDYWSLDLPRETESYVPKLLALRIITLNPDLYSATLKSIPDEPYFEHINIGSQLDLAQAANLADMSMDEFYRLNPGFNRWATDPNGPHTLCIPVTKSSKFKEKLQNLPTNERVTWERYTIKPGDALSKIAAKHNTSIDLLQNINAIKGNNIRAGKTLLVPRASAANQHYVLSASQRLLAKQKKGRGKRVQYVVKNGDSLWSIGKKMGVSVKNLTKWNALSAKDTIRPGKKLAVWIQPSNKSASATDTTRKVAYKVKKGDSLARIANKFDVKIADIVNWNKVNTKKYLQPGDRLTLFIDITNISL